MGPRMTARARRSAQTRAQDTARARRVAGGPRRRRHHVLLLAVLVVITFAAYHPAWHGAPLWDDEAHLTRSELRSIDGLGRIWFELGATQRSYPLLHSTFWVLPSVLRRRHARVSPGEHRAARAARRCCSRSCSRRLQVPWPWLAALVFALHPVHVESVAWISELKNTLVGRPVPGGGPRLPALRSHPARPGVGGGVRRGSCWHCSARPSPRRCPPCSSS